MSGQGLPASVAIGEDVGEANAGHEFPGGIRNLIQTANEGEVAVYVGVYLGEVIRPGSPLGDVRQHLAAGVQGAVHVGVFEFVGDHAGDSIGIFAAEGVGPGMFQLDERRLGLRLILRAIFGEGGHGQQEGEYYNQGFHS